ncbi:hypothetical protein EZV62_019367 [Acer yangbiense]|uniref:Major facilitator superfamily (MFS) profile domain-containing protein n=1 Tax=Acer yangbiense TaxID=1000413 RepID=A0A5C7HB03_9ROSI|nr:hypothetical protein EZV62_019367 [Acer yangbiense]
MVTSSSVPLSAPTPSWFTPKRLLAIFCVINMLNYVDRGAIASNGVNGSRKTCSESGTCTSGSGIQGDFNLNNFEDGVLSSAFMVGLLVASPIFASLAKSVNPFRLIGVGLSVWTFAVVGCGFSMDFWSITIFRMLVGVGEASFISLAAPFIDDNAPVAQIAFIYVDYMCINASPVQIYSSVEMTASSDHAVCNLLSSSASNLSFYQKTAWLSIFYMCIPTGYALGYIYGGLVGSHFNWRFAFWGEAILMLPFAVLGFVMKPLQLKGFAPVESKQATTAIETSSVEVHDDAEAEVTTGRSHALSVKDDVEDKGSNKCSRSTDTSNNLNQFSIFFKDVKVLLLNKVYVVNVLGYIAYTFVIGAYSYWGPKAGKNIYNMSNADLIFGGVTIVCGILGTIAGGYALDFMTSTISNSFKLLSATTLIGALFCFGAFCFKSLYGFLALFSIGELLIFAIQGPVNYTCLHCVKPSMRPLSMAISTVSIHIFGDVPSSPLVGAFQDYVNNWRETALILTAILFPAAGIWFIGIFLHSVDRFNEDSTHQVSSTTERSNTTPLLEERKAEATSSSAEP